jgi:hypothetical protein
MHVSVHGLTYAQRVVACLGYLSTKSIATPNRRDADVVMAFAVRLREELL